MKNKLIIILSIIQIFSTSCSDKKSSDFVSSDGIVSAFSAGNAAKWNKSNEIEIL
jgi:hypothetical protein